MSESPPPHPAHDRKAALARAGRELNDLIAVRAYDEGRAGAGHRPIELYMQVASACNLDCYMCSEHNRPPEWRRGRGATSLPPELFEKVERELFPFAARLTIGVGGEPMISPHFLDYVRRADAAGLDVHVMTNGTRIRTPEAAETLARCTNSMEISVDAATPETYERIRLGSKWASLNANLERLVAAIREAPPGRRTHLSLCFVLMRSNLHEFPAFVEFGHRIGADRVAGWHIIPVTEEGQDESLQAERERSNEVLAAARQRAQELGLEIDVPAPFDLGAAALDPLGVDLAAQLPEQVSVALATTATAGEAPPVGAVEPADATPGETVEFEVRDHRPPERSSDSNGRVAGADTDQEASTDRSRGMAREASRRPAAVGRIHCSSPTTSVFLFYDGRVLPCCHPHAHAQMPMGNLWDSSFAEIWNGPLYRNLRAGLFTGDAPPLCQTCSIVHSPPPQVEHPEELLAPGNDLAAWYAGRELGARAEEHAPGWADEAVLEELARVKSELAQTADRAEVLGRENSALTGHAENLQRVVTKTGAARLYRIGSWIQDTFLGGKRG